MLITATIAVVLLMSGAKYLLFGPDEFLEEPPQPTQQPTQQPPVVQPKEPAALKDPCFEIELDDD